jgi:hypothetical protein
MRISVNVRIDQQPGGSFGYGNIGFEESAELVDAGFETVSKVFTRIHELLNVLKSEHERTRPAIRK